MARAFRVGLTGGLASGKSTVGKQLSEAGFRVVDADRLVAELYRPGEEGAAAVRRLFGDEFLEANGSVDHKRLGRRIFSDAQARRALEQAIHPLVGRRFEAIAADEWGPVVFEATLLVEAGVADEFDLVVTVESDTELRLTRAMAKGLDRASAEARLAAQGEGRQRRSRADRVIWNSGTLQELRAKVDELVEEIRKRVVSDH
jgi:dephospho-CoA kinase